jgi:succinate dehydrogenase/fumarate reductase flavoprotein subunit
MIAKVAVFLQSRNCPSNARTEACFRNLFAAGGAAVGISGATAAGYLSGNGLLTATVLGRLAGQAAAAVVSISN